MSKEKVLSLTRKDFEWQFFRAGGKGGQKQNKTSSACRCIHRPSNSTGESREERSQSQNRKIAFKRCCETKSFQNWVHVTVSNLEKVLDEALRPENIREETYTPHEVKGG